MATDDSPFSDLYHPSLTGKNADECALIEDLHTAIQAMRMQLSRVKWCVELGEELSDQLSNFCGRSSPVPKSHEDRTRMGRLSMWRMIPAKQLVIELQNFAWAYASFCESVNKLNLHRETLKSPDEWRAVRREFTGKFPFLKEIRNFISHTGEETSKNETLQSNAAPGPNVLGFEIAPNDILFGERIAGDILIMTISGKELQIDVSRRTLSALDKLANRIVACIKEDTD